MANINVTLVDNEIRVDVGENTATAGFFASAAEDARDAAEDARDESINAKDLALLAALAVGPYADTAAGIADTSDGVYFYTVQPANIYLNDSGTAVLQDEIATLGRSLGTFTSPLIDDNTTIKAALESVGANLALTGGASGVGFAQLITGSTLRTLQSKVSETALSIRDAGAVENSGSPTGVDTILANIVPGQTLNAARTAAVAGGCAFSRTNSSFDITRGCDLYLEPGVDLRVDQTAGERDNVIDYNITLGLNETTPATTGEYRGAWLRGGRVFTNALSGTQIASGGYGVAIGTGSSKTITGMTLEKMTIFGGEGAVKINSANNRGAGSSESQWNQIVRCTLNGNTVFAAEDGLIAVDCIAFSQDRTKPAYTFNMTFGAFCSGVFRGTTVGVGGAAFVQNGSLVKFHNVQMEHAPGMGSGTPATGLPGGAQMFITGFTYKSQGGEILGCNFGAGSFITNTVYFADATGWVIDRTQMNTANGGASADLLITSQAATAAQDTDNLTVGYNMNWRGARPIRAVGSLTDVSRRMIIDQTGASLRKQHRGIWFGLFSLLTSKASGLTDSSFEAMIEHSGMVTLQGNVTRAGFFGSGVAVCTFPSWMLPHRDVVIPVHSVTGARAVGNLSATTGVFTIQDGGMAAVTDLWFPAAAWKAIVNPDYVTVA